MKLEEDYKASAPGEKLMMKS